MPAQEPLTARLSGAPCLTALREGAGDEEGFLEGGFVVACLLGLSLELFMAREKNLVHPVAGSLQDLGDVLPTVLLQEAAHRIHVQRACGGGSRASELLLWPVTKASPPKDSVFFMV